VLHYAISFSPVFVPVGKPKSTGIPGRGLGVEGLKPGPIVGALLWEFLSGFSGSKNLAILQKAATTAQLAHGLLAEKSTPLTGSDIRSAARTIR